MQENNTGIQETCKEGEWNLYVVTCFFRLMEKNMDFRALIFRVVASSGSSASIDAAQPNRITQFFRSAPLLSDYLDIYDIDEEYGEDGLYDDCDTAVGEIIKRHLEEVEDKIETIYPDCPLRNNIYWLSECLGLSPTERDVLIFYAVLKQDHHRVLLTLLDMLGDHFSHDGFLQHLSWIVGHPLDSIRSLFVIDAALMQAGVFQRNQTDPRGDYITNYYSINPHVLWVLQKSYQDSEALVSALTWRAPKVSLSLKDDYVHLKERLWMAVNIIRMALIKKQRGVNIVIYQAPATEQLALATAITQEINATLHMVRVLDECGKIIPPSAKIMEYHLYQNVLQESDEDNVVVLNIGEGMMPVHSDTPFLDPDIDDELRILHDSGMFAEMLDNNPVPTIWLDDQTDQIDNRLLGKFSFHLELPDSFAKAKSKHIEENITPYVNHRWLTKVKNVNWITQSMVEKGAELIEMMGFSGDRDESEELLKVIWENEVDAQGGDRSVVRDSLGNQRTGDDKKSISASDTGDQSFSLNYLNLDINPGKVIRYLAKHHKGRFLLSGPPGTGKTEFAKFAANSIRRPAEVIKVSDVFDKWVGETEKRIEKIFQRASLKRSVLIIDEVDSLLQNRQGAQRRFEVSQVNQFLTELDNFKGILFASTNLPGEIEEAVLRRFSLKIQFNFLEPHQQWEYLREIIKREGGALPRGKKSTIAKNRCMQIQNLSPGDFRAVRGRLEIEDHLLNLDAWMTALEQEVGRKKAYVTSRRIGF